MKTGTIATLIACTLVLAAAIAWSHLRLTNALADEVGGLDGRIAALQTEIDRLNASQRDAEPERPRSPITLTGRVVRKAWNDGARGDGRERDEAGMVTASMSISGAPKDIAFLSVFCELRDQGGDRRAQVVKEFGDRTLRNDDVVQFTIRIEPNNAIEAWFKAAKADEITVVLTPRSVTYTDGQSVSF